MIKAKTVANLTKKVMMITMITRSKVERDAQRTTTLAEISSVSTVTKLTCPIPHFTLIWSKSIPRVLMENWETRQLVVEEEVDQERTHIRDKTLELKISSRPLKEMEVQWTHYAASRKSTISYSRCRTQIPPSLLPLLDHSNKACMTILSTSTSSSSHQWLMKTAISSSKPKFQVHWNRQYFQTTLKNNLSKIKFHQWWMKTKMVMYLKKTPQQTI